MTARQFISDALMEIGILGADETLDPADADLGLRHLQSMVDLLQADRLLLYTVTSAAYTFVPGKNSYSIGPDAGNDWFGARPIWITHIGVDPVGSTTRVTVDPFLYRDEWLAVPNRNQTASYPSRYYLDLFAAGFSVIEFWPVPTTSAVAVVSTPVPLTTPLTLDTDLVFPPGGYLEGWRLNLTRRLERPFQVPEDPGLRIDAAAALAQIRRLNDEVAPWSRSDPAVVGPGTYDIRSGTYR